MNCSKVLIELKKNQDDINSLYTICEKECGLSIAIPPVDDEINFSNDDGYIYKLFFFANAVSPFCNKRDILNTLISLIARKSQNIEKCMISENEKIFTALNNVVDILNKANVRLKLSDIFNGFIGEALNLAKENLEKEKQIYISSDEDVKPLEEAFKENVDFFLNRLQSLMYGGGNAPAFDVDSLLSKINVSSTSNKEVVKKIESLADKIDNLKNEIAQMLQNFDFSSVSSVDKNVTFNNDEELLMAINENIKTLKEEVKNVIENAISPFIEEFEKMQSKTKDDLDTFLQKQTEIIDSLHNALNQVKNTNEMFVIIDKRTEELDRKISDEIEKRLNEMFEFIKEEARKADELEKTIK